MTIWADYLISAVQYDDDRKIVKARQHIETDKGITNGDVINRSTILTNIKHGKTYSTIYQSLSTWTRGQSISANHVMGTSYLRIDKNKVEYDHLGSVVELDLQEIISNSTTLPAK